MRKFVAGVFTLVSVSAVADSNITYTCKLNNAERVITVAYTAPDKKVPCEVQYKNNGETKTLWNYQSTEGQCEKAAEDFVAKQTSWGWDCKTDAAAPAAQ